MKRLGLRFARKKPVRSSTQGSLTVSAAAPNSGFAFIDNSEGASAALNELSTAISEALDLIDLDDALDDGQSALQLQRLEAEAGTFLNSSSNMYPDLEEWSCTRETAHLVNVAFQCAAAVYSADPKSSIVHDADGSHSSAGLLHRKPVLDGVEYKELGFVDGNWKSLAKAIGFWQANGPNIPDQVSTPPTFVIAIRGTQKIIDKLVNLNGRPADVTEWLGIDQQMSQDGFPKSVHAHSGFVVSAQASLAIVEKHLAAIENAGQPAKVILTGHSAGGAVASLLYARLTLNNSFPGLEINCITFGAPPTISITGETFKSLHRSVSSLPKPGVNLALVNEFDVVPRADQTYIRSLIDLFRSVYNLEPIMQPALDLQRQESGALTDQTQLGSATATPDSSTYTLPPLQFDRDVNITEQYMHSVSSRAEPTNSTIYNSVETLYTEKDVGHTVSSEKQWNLATPQYHIFGDIVLLRKDRTGLPGGGNASRKLRAFSPTQTQYENLLYTGVKTHSRTYYQDRITLLGKGSFNSASGWENGL